MANPGSSWNLFGIFCVYVILGGMAQRYRAGQLFCLLASAAVFVPG